MMKRQCKFFPMGSCRKGTSCEFIHDTQQQQQMDGMQTKSGIYILEFILKNIHSIFRCSSL